MPSSPVDCERSLGIVVSTIASDSHTWNLVFLQLLLEEHGHSVCNVGPCATVEDVVDRCRRRRRPDLLVMSTLNGHGLIEAPAYVRAVRRSADLRDMPVVIGGKLGVGGQADAEAGAALLAAGFDAVFTSPTAIDEFKAYLGRLVSRPVTTSAAAEQPDG